MVRKQGLESLCRCHNRGRQELLMTAPLSISVRHDFMLEQPNTISSAFCKGHAIRMSMTELGGQGEMRDQSLGCETTEASQSSQQGLPLPILCTIPHASSTVHVGVLLLSVTGQGNFCLKGLGSDGFLGPFLSITWAVTVQPGEEV